MHNGMFPIMQASQGKVYMMDGLKNISLKTRMALSISLLFVVFGAIMAFATLSYFERRYDETTLNHQFTLVSTLAFSIDNKLGMMQNALTGAAERLTPAIASDPARAREYLDARPALLALFDDGIFIISREGEVIAESSGLPRRPGAGNPFRNFSRKTLESGRPYISTHYLSTHLPGNPALFMTVPLFDGSGEMYAILGGSIDLFGKNLFQELSRARIGTSGYLFLCDHDGNIIIHPDRKRALEKVPAGVNKLFDRARAGFEGSGKTVNSQGVRMLASFKHLESNDWIVGANLPMDEAYAPLYQARRYFILGMSAATSLILVIAWLLMRRLTAPLMLMTRHVETIQEKSGGERLIEIDREDEIGTLAKAFNGMLDAIEKQQEALRESEQRFQETLANVRLIAVMLDPHGRVMFCNDFLLELTGYLRDELVGRDYFAILIPAGIRDEIRGVFLRMVESDEMISFYENEIVTRGGEPRTVRWNNTVLRDLDGKITGTSSIGEDITERKRAEKEIECLNSDLQRRATELAAVNKELEAFSYSLSHDLKVPLTIISIAGQSLAESCAGELDENGKFFIESICSASDRMDQLLDAMLTLSRLTRSELSMEEVDLSGLAREVLLELRVCHPERQVECVIADGLTARCDRNMLKAALENLLGNAWKYTGKVAAPLIEFGAMEMNGERVFFVRDNGAGFDMRQAEKLFQPFQRLHREEEFAGTGIGLATVQRIMNRHRGRVWAEGEPGKGATFYFTLPETGT